MAVFKQRWVDLSSAQLLRLVLLFIMVGLLFVMAEFPAIYSGPRVKALIAAYGGPYSGNLSSGSQLARKTMHREIAVIEVLLGAAFSGAIALFERVGRCIPNESQA